MLFNSKILGHGYFLPSKILKNNDFLKFVDTSDEWIFSRTGIKQRHIAAKEELTSDLAVNASKKALKSVLDGKGAYVFETGNVANVALGLMDPLALSKGPFVFCLSIQLCSVQAKSICTNFGTEQPPLYQTWRL